MKTSRVSMRRKTAKQLDREIAEALSRRAHATKKTVVEGGRWNHRSVARSHDVPEDVVRRIYATAQTAKRQGLHGGYLADLVERNVGRKLVGGEYSVLAKAKGHLNYDPPGGYGGPKPKGASKEPPRARSVDRDVEEIRGRGNLIIDDVLRRRKHPTFGWDETKDAEDRELLREAADELEVAADLYESAGARVTAGTLRQRAGYARQGNYRMLEAYAA